MQEVMGEQYPDEEDEFQDALKNGVVLCHLANKIRPNSIKKVRVNHTSILIARSTKVPFSSREKMSVLSLLLLEALAVPKWIFSALAIYTN